MDKRGLCEMRKLQNCENGFEITKRPQVNPPRRESRKRQGARAYLVAGKAEPRQGETEIRSYEFPLPHVGNPDIPCTGARIRSYEFPYAMQVKSIVAALEKRCDPPHA